MLISVKKKVYIIIVKSFFANKNMLLPTRTQIVFFQLKKKSKEDKYE